MNLELLAKDHELDLLKEEFDNLIAKPKAFLAKIDLDKVSDLSKEEYVEIYEYLDSDLDKLLYKLTARIILDKSVTAQALVGMLFNRVRYSTARQHIIDITLNAIASNPFISVKRIGMYLKFSCNLELSNEIKTKRKQMNYVLPSIELPLTVKHNNEIGYRTIQESLICGGSLKHHDKPLNLNHINRLNRNPYRIETRLPFLVKPKFDPTPKMKDNGEMETEQDISKRYQTWNRLMEEIPEKNKLLALQGNRFYIHHRFDNGGRTYTKAFHMNYQGIAYCKALVQAYNKELVEPDF